MYKATICLPSVPGIKLNSYITSINFHYYFTKILISHLRVINRTSHTQLRNTRPLFPLSVVDAVIRIQISCLVGYTFHFYIVVSLITPLLHYRSLSPLSKTLTL